MGEEDEIFHISSRPGDPKVVSEVIPPAIPWNEKYRPTDLADLSYDELLHEILNKMASSKRIPHCIFIGPPGVGKTSAIMAIGRKIFGPKFNERVAKYNASDNRGIKSVRGVITDRACLRATEIHNPDGSVIPGYHLIILDEADFMTGKAQDALRVTIEKYSKNARFCFICNYGSKISDAIKSRCVTIYFPGLSDQLVTKVLSKIMVAEQFQVSDEVIHSITHIAHGDMRRAIGLLQNVKLLYDYRQMYHRPYHEVSRQLANNNFWYLADAPGPEVSPDDVYDLVGCISPSRAHTMVEHVRTCQLYSETVAYSATIMDQGYPADEAIHQLANALLANKTIPILDRAKCLHGIATQVQKIKNGANARLQLNQCLTMIWQHTRYSSEEIDDTE